MGSRQALAFRVARLRARLDPSFGMTVVFHADDFGLTEGVTRGIVECSRRGVVHATTAMMCMPGSEERVARWAREFRGSIGVHLQLTGGTPRTEAARVPSLVDESGRFRHRSAQLAGCDAAEILVEWRAQVQALRDLGLTPTHLDTHHSVQTWPAASSALRQLAREQRLAVRAVTRAETAELRAEGVSCAGGSVMNFYDCEVTTSALLDRICVTAFRLPFQSTIAVMCHPGYADEELARVSSYVAPRQRELELLCSAELPHELARYGFRVGAAV